jgi:PTH1 family peptidyl-tRNA hydrolase
MKLIAGLGNPGRKYAGHRHNVGFMAVEEIARRHGFSPWRRGFSGEVAEGRLGGEKVLLLKPLTFMNESGRAVGEVVRFHRLSPQDVIVIHDELDLAPGRIRLKTGGGHAGHNGLRSIIAHIGPDFHRLRIGIGHPGRRELVSGYVLHDFSRSERQWLEPLLDAIAENAELLVRGDFAGFANRVALQAPPPREE